MSAELFVVGVSFRTAPLEVRERLAFPDEAMSESLASVMSLPSVREAMLISTCNRVEVYGVAHGVRGGSAAQAAASEVRRFLSADRQMDDELLSRHVFEHVGQEAVRHMFRVASSLDSLVVGEAQILGQVKSAYGAASQAGTIGVILDRCLQRAFGVAKRVRTETEITRGGANVSTAAVELAKRIFSDLTGRRVLLLGAGKMSRLAARHLRADGAEIWVTNRSPQRAEELAHDMEGAARPWGELEHWLEKADIVITSTGATEPILTHGLMKRIMKARRRETLFLIDIAVPRDVEPAVGKLDGVYLFDVDDLQEVVAENIKARHREAEEGEAIVGAEVARFEAWLRSQDVVPTIKELRERFQLVARAELDRTVERMGDSLTPEQTRAMEQLVNGIVNKLLHTPLMTLRHGDSEDSEELVKTTRRLFALPEETQ